LDAVRLAVARLESLAKVPSGDGKDQLTVPTVESVDSVLGEFGPLLAPKQTLDNNKQARINLLLDRKAIEFLSVFREVPESTPVS